MREIGEGTVRLLLEILDGNELAPVSITLPHTLMVRGSTAAAPAEAARSRTARA
jgi:DNA-binding LacI/PurR family transcriptional regulator